MSLPTPQGVTSLTFKPPPLDGSLTFPELFDYNATHSPKHPLFRYDDLDNGGFRTILWEEGVAAFHTAGHYFKKYIHGDAPITVGILANTNSITYFAVLAGLMRLGFIPFPISIRNSVVAIVHLMKSSGASHLIISQDVSLRNTANMVGRQFWEADINDKITIIPLPHFSDLFSVKPGEYDPLPPVRPAWSQTALIIHSSGSTRFPSPIHTTHKNALRNASRPYYGEMDVCGEVFGVQAMPMYHAMGFLSVSLSTATGAIIVSFPPIYPPLIPTAERFLSSIIDTKTTLVVTVPSFLVEWARDPKAIEALKSTTAVMYGGGPLEKDAGDILVANGILVISIYGLTESGVSMVFPRSIPAEGWGWMKVGSYVDAVFMPTDEKDIYRLYVKESLHHSPAVLDAEIDGVRALDTKDLVQLHSSNRELFKVYGRADDQIMHSTGEKTNPVPIEAGLTTDKRITAALMFGRSKFQPGVLILPAPEEVFDPSDTTRLAKYRASICNTVTKVNEQAPQHSRIYKEMILVAKPSKPFEFTAKGTLQRKAILKAYEQEIEDLYKAIDDVSQADVVIPQLWTLKNVMTMMRNIVTAILEQKIGDSDDIFVAGGDSLTAMSIRNSLLRALRKSKVVPVVVIRALPPNFVFDLPSIAVMSAFIHGIVLGAPASPAAEVSTRSGEVDEAAHREVDPSPDRSQNVVKLRDGAGEPPLIVIHGAGGVYFEYASYADKFRTAVWTLTITPETPLNSLPELASFYFAKIKAERPHGPYRFASYSSSSLLLVVLLKIFEDNGDEVAQAVMLDHFPAMFVHSANRFGNPDPRVPENIRNMLDMGMSAIEGLMDRDSNRDTLQRAKNLLLDGWKGVYANDIIRNAIRNIKGFLTANSEFVYDLATDETGLSSIELMAQWMRTVKVPITVVVAPEGALGAVPEEDRTSWTDLGTKRCLPGARVVFVKGGHYEFLTNEVVLQLLQEGY
ncbi:NRPS-like enzyme [Desarmillaria tabescens]|uniref:NRPS-like enzyme n=1 Tax=Armillaria tabescens TaxID=1929756 RepID=A0AA39MY18_ARMTA|nr:NRPS-like enzyme [Desarmillaria tabescens]KAK0451171.1 NRPS-like enzyme [Desarmillaria tabescens]